MKTLFLILTIATVPIFAQENLVPNGSFEEYTSCPLLNELGNLEFNKCIGWWYTTPSQIGTPDYFNACNNQVNGGTGVVGVPNNFWGYQPAFDGDGYVGFVAFSYSFSLNAVDGTEPIQCRLKIPLKSCTKYAFKCRVNLSNKSSHGISKLSINVSKDSLIMPQSDLYEIDNWLAIQPTWTNDTPIIDTVNWIRIKGDFIAKGGEQFLTIGYFEQDFDFTDLYENDTAMATGWNAYGVYIFIDSVQLIEIGPIENCESIVEIPNVFTPNFDETNDYIDFSMFQKVTILNRWGTTVLIMDSQSNFQWHGKNFREEDLPDGVYYYIAEKADLKITGSIHLLR